MTAVAAPADPRLALLARLDQAAATAEQAEKAFKREIEGRIAVLERERTFAYRRQRLVAAMLAPAPAEGREAGIRVRLSVAFDHIGWPAVPADQDPTEREVGAALAPVAGALEDLAASRQGDDALAVLAAFEAWYRIRFGTDFLEVFERRAEFRALVDF